MNVEDESAGVFDGLVAAVRPAEISEAQRLRMRRRIGERIASQLLAGVTTLRAEDVEWRELCPRVSFKVLRVDAAAGNQTILVRAEPGGVLPRHRHTQDEEFIVLEGECRIGDLRLAAGDANFAAAGSWHDDITTDTGVLVLVRGEYPPPAYA
jgi:quercetin dioxygenase-like cupin family protein